MTVAGAMAMAGANADRIAAAAAQFSHAQHNE
jgi:hypothetical protein